VAPPAAYAWVFEERAPCREEGLAPVQEAYDAYLAAEADPAPRLRRQAAKRLTTVTRREGSDDAVLEALRALAPAQDPEVAALRAAVIRTLDGRDGTLGAMLDDDSPVVRRAALLEAGWWAFLRRHAEAMDRALAAPEARTRKALATAAAKHGDPEVLRRVVELLMDPDLDVRKEAWSVFLQHRGGLIGDYDPKTDDDARRPFYESLKRALAP